MMDGRPTISAEPQKGPAAGLLERPTRESLERLREQHLAFVSDPVGTDTSTLRPVIARSWRRSMACKVSPDRVLGDVREARIEQPVLDSALPVIDDLERLATDTGACISLTDAAGAIAVFRGDRSVMRWADSRFATIGGFMREELVGTNSDGTALEEGASVQVWGAEHFSESLHDAFCTSVPIRDPIRRNIKAVLSLTVPEKIALMTDPSSLAFIVEGAAAEIARAMAQRLAVREQALLNAYLRESRKRGAVAVLAIDERTTIASNTAQQLLTPDDYAVISGYAKEAEQAGVEQDRLVSLTGNRVLNLRATPVITDAGVVGTVVKLRPHSPEVRLTNRHSGPAPQLPGLVGESTVLREARTSAAGALQRKLAVCITGERGTGRSLLAGLMAQRLGADPIIVECGPDRRLNGTSPTAELTEALLTGRPVVALHLDQLPVDQWGTVSGLLRTASTRAVLVVTAHRLTGELCRMASEDELHEIPMPALRSRREDIPSLVAHFLAQAAPDRSVHPTPKLLQALTKADWPGNVAELREVVFSATTANEKSSVCLADLGEFQRKAMARGRLTRLEEAELEQIRAALDEAQGNRLKAAELLGIGRSTLYRKIDSYSRRGIDLGN